MDVLGRLISVFGAASATFGQVICQTQQSQTNKQTNNSCAFKLRDDAKCILCDLAAIIR